ncbi:MAG TPA: LPS export ABC transporter permease LptF [Paracoccaceae bacterium]|nr:LPS export ABC transporter permease LptF [Paracoccaceae bacterium]
MSRFDRYLLSQLLALFGFFALVLVLVYWVNRAVGLFDRLIGDGQSALVFLEFSLLTLPNAIRIVLPVAAFAAAVYVTNRLSQDGELTVMQATGFSSFRLARPVAMFGLCVAGMMLALTHWAVPASRVTLAERSSEIRANVTARFLSEGRFMHPARGITFYIRAISDTGELQDVFLADDRNDSARMVYTARRALIVRDEAAAEGPGVKLIMFDGMSQTLNRASGRMAITLFQDFTYDLGSLMPQAGRDRRTLDELSTRALLSPTPALVAETKSSRAEMLAEGHSRFAQPFLALAAALVGFSALLVGGFSRFGLWRQILGAIVALIFVQMVDNAATATALRDERAWALVYFAPLVGVGVAVAVLAYSQRPRRIRPALPEGAAA